MYIIALVRSIKKESLVCKDSLVRETGLEPGQGAQYSKICIIRFNPETTSYNDITRIIVTYCFFDHDTFQSYKETYGDDL